MSSLPKPVLVLGSLTVTLLSGFPGFHNLSFGVLNEHFFEALNENKQRKEKEVIVFKERYLLIHAYIYAKLSLCR